MGAPQPNVGAIHGVAGAQARRNPWDLKGSPESAKSLEPNRRAGKNTHSAVGSFAVPEAGGRASPELAPQTHPTPTNGTSGSASPYFEGRCAGRPQQPPMADLWGCGNEGEAVYGASARDCDGQTACEPPREAPDRPNRLSAPDIPGGRNTMCATHLMASRPIGGTLLETPHHRLSERWMWPAEETCWPAALCGALLSSPTNIHLPLPRMWGAVQSPSPRSSSQEPPRPPRPRRAAAPSSNTRAHNPGQGLVAAPSPPCNMKGSRAHAPWAHAIGCVFARVGARAHCGGRGPCGPAWPCVLRVGCVRPIGDEWASLWRLATTARRSRRSSSTRLMRRRVGGFESGRSPVNG